MGIKGLWNVLSPYCENKPLSEIKGEAVAIDLSCWVCDAQNITEHYVQPKLYLRNLFFRTSYLLLNDITPLYVLDGDAPDGKLAVMQERNKKQFRGAQPHKKTDAAENPPSRKPKTDRKRFKTILKECCELLNSLGVQYVAADGEAEQLCAFLNSEGFVSGVVSTDSDCFAYGANRVLRNLSPSAVDVYDISKICRDTGWGRYKCISMAFLCGCDYTTGLTSAHATAATFLRTIADSIAIDRLKSWRSDDSVYIKLMKDSKQRIACKPCDKCCEVRSSVNKAKSELKFAEKARAMVDEFPPPLVLEEFLSKPNFDGTIHTDWKRPDLVKFARIMSTKIGWNERYCVEKFIPLLTGWQLRQTNNAHSNILQPERINKTRKIQGVQSVEVLWKDVDGLYIEFVPDDQFAEEECKELLWTTVEPVDLFSVRYPEIYETFLEGKKKPKKTKTKETKQKDPKTVVVRKRKKPIDRACGIDSEYGNKITEYLIDKPVGNGEESQMEDRKNLPRKQTPVSRKRKTANVSVMKRTKASKKCTLQITLRTFVNNKKDSSYSQRARDSLIANESVCNLSEIIDNIVKRKRANTKYGNINLIFDSGCERTTKLNHHKPLFTQDTVQCSTPKKQPRRLSHFFESIEDGRMDDFEVSLNKMVNITSNDPEQTVELKFAGLETTIPDCSNRSAIVNNVSSERDDSSDSEVYESLSIRVAKLRAGII